MRRLLKRLAAREDGNFAVITALSIVPVIGLAGMGVEFSQAYSVRTSLQGEADAIAIAVASESPLATESRFFDTMSNAAKARIGQADVHFTGSWISETDYRVHAEAALPRHLTRLVPVGGETIEVSASTTARYLGVKLVYKPPELAMLDPEAGDYNRVYAYCFDNARAQTDREGARSQRTAIADNGGTVYEEPIPQCSAGEVLSFELYNVRDARTNRARWDDGVSERYTYHTDTVRDPEGRETYDLGGWSILETVLCPSLELCKNQTQGGVVPFGRDRTPVRNTEPCKPGSFMYYGWEDRPPGRGHSDRDYDDIRVILECPVVVREGTEHVRLVR